MNEKVWKAFLKLMKEAHGMEEAEVTRYLGDETLLEEKITELKNAPSDNYKEGLTDGTKKAKATVIKSLKKELEIDITDVDKIEKIGEVIKPLVAQKFKGEPNTPVDESQAIKDLKKTFEDKITKLTAEKDEEVTKAKSEATETSRQLKMEAIARKLLTDEGYMIPSEKEHADMKFELASSYLGKKGFKYEFDEKDNKFYRIGEDNVRVRGKGNKPVSYEDDLKQVYDVNYGKAPAKGKGSAELPNNGGGSQSTGSYDFTKWTSKTINAPTTVEEGVKLLRNPLLSLDDRKLAREFVEAEQAKEEPEPATT